MDELLKKYLMNKGGLPEEQFGEGAYAKAKADAEEQKSGLGVAQLIGGVGDAIAGRSSDATAKNFDSIRKGIDERTVGELDKRKKDYMSETSFANQQTEVAEKQSRRDPNSPINQKLRASIMASTPALAKNMGENFNQITVDDYDYIMKPHQFAEQIKSREQSAKILAGQRADAQQLRADSIAQKLDEKEQGLKTPFGIANTTDDAKQLKEAFESKRNFDNKLQEMINLRTSNKGGALLDREAVGRGKQLSKDLLLEYKNMAKLGVLSQSDEAIINAIIPEDPLEYNSPMAAIQGQDPILHKLKKFKGDSDTDFKTRVATRTRSGVESAATPEKQQKTVVKTQTNQKTGEKRIVYSDGTFEIVSSIAGGK